MKNLLSIDELDNGYDAYEALAIQVPIDADELSIDLLTRYKYFRSVDNIDKLELAEEVLDTKSARVYDEY